MEFELVSVRLSAAPGTAISGVRHRKDTAR
jgi:hypothetical protein